MLKKLFISLIFFLFSLLLIAEFKTNVHFISRREGLSNGAVNAIVKDAEGYIWFGTWNSLTRYEGNNIVNFLPDNNTYSIQNDISMDHSDRYGTLVSVYGRGIFKFDSTTQQFQRIICDKTSLMTSLSIKWIYLVDKSAYFISGDGQLFVLSGDRLQTILHLPITGTLTSSISVEINDLINSDYSDKASFFDEKPAVLV